MVTYTGRVVDPCNLQIEDVDINDIAHSLSMQCRFAGHTREFYSVAQHSIRVCETVEGAGFASADVILQALLHDATEAYVQDIIRPIKYDTKMKGYRILEERVWTVVAQHFNIPLIVFPIVDRADKRALKAELLQFTKIPHARYHEWMDDIEELAPATYCMAPDEAEQAFLAEFHRLGGRA